MKDEEKTKEQLMSELAALRQRVGKLETSEAERKRALEALAEKIAELSEIDEILEEKERLMAAFERIGQAVLASLDLEQMLDALAEQIVEIGIFRSLMIALVDEQTHSVEVVRNLARLDDDSIVRNRHSVIGIRYDLDDANITAEIARTGEMQIVLGWDDRYDKRFDRPEDHGGQVAYFIPVKQGDRVLAVLATGSRIEEKEETLRRIEVMHPLLNEVAIALEHARLYRALREREEMEKELQVAYNMQMDLMPMPRASPEIPGLDIAGRCLPANRVGGDYFDYLWVDEEHTNLCIVLADVAGSAMQAAIPVVMFSGMLHATLEHASSPSDLFNHLNRFLLSRLEPHSFISCCVAHVDVRSKRMVLCNAGQPGPLVRRGEEIHTISMETSHWPLGILSEVHYEDVVSDLQEGDVVLFHTDGAIEAQNEAGELYGFDRLEAVLCSRPSPETDAEAWIEGILEEVRGFSGTAPQRDDITFVVLKVGT